MKYEIFLHASIINVYITLFILLFSRFTLELKCETETTTKNLENQLDLKAFIGMYVFLIIGVSSGLMICLLGKIFVS